MKWFISKVLVRGYQVLINPMIHWIAGPGAGCRFQPSCSAFFQEAVEAHGSLRGSWMGILRICRCHPWGGMGPDPVPPKKLKV